MKPSDLSAETARFPAAASIRALADRLTPLRRKAVPRTLAVVGAFSEDERRALAALLLPCGLWAVLFYEDGWETRCTADGVTRLPLRDTGELPAPEQWLSLPLRGAEEAASLAYVCAGAEEAGCAALAADGAGLAGAAFFSLPGGAAGAVFFGGGTSSAVLTPRTGAFPERPDGTEAARRAERLYFLAACFLYGAGGLSFLEAADRIRRAARKARAAGEFI